MLKSDSEQVCILILIAYFEFTNQGCLGTFYFALFILVVFVCCSQWAPHADFMLKMLWSRNSVINSDRRPECTEQYQQAWSLKWAQGAVKGIFAHQCVTWKGSACVLLLAEPKFFLSQATVSLQPTLHCSNLALIFNHHTNWYCSAYPGRLLWNSKFYQVICIVGRKPIQELTRNRWTQ